MADEQKLNDPQRPSWRDKSKQWFITGGTVLALLTTIIGFLSDSVGVVEFVRNMGVSPTPTAVEVVVVPDLPTPAPSPTPTPEPSATPVVTPSPTPLPVMAAPGQRLLIVAQFSNFATDASFNVAGRIHEALAQQVRAANLEDTEVAIWPDVVEDNQSAMEVIEGTGAALVIWGEYDSGRVRVRFTLAGSSAEVDWQRLLSAPTELSTTINLDVPREAQALALITLGRLYRNAGDMERSRAAFAQALAQSPSDADTVATLNFYLAFLDASSSPPEIDRAIEGYDKVIELRPEWINARYNRGLAYLTRYWLTTETSNLDAAIEDFTWTIGEKANYGDAYINRGIAYFARNVGDDLDAAIADFTAAIERDENSYRGYYNRGLVYIRKDLQEKWVADLEAALTAAPTYWPAHHALCWGYALDAMPEEGLPHCEEAVSQDASGSTRDARGLVLAQLDRLDEAATDLEQYVAYLDTQPEVWSEINSQHIYLDLIAGLRAGENPVTPEVLAELR